MCYEMQRELGKESGDFSPTLPRRLAFIHSFIYSFIPFYSDSVLGFKNKMVIKTRSVAD